jgi:serine phosphatase RsbU (regulator of sigma subunit)
VYTDGITEQKNEIGEEFGEERLYTIFSSAREQASLSALCIEQFDQFRESVPQQDDISLLTIFFS